MDNQCDLLSTLEKNQEMNLFFHTLPQAVQETMVQSGLKADNLEELKKCAQNFMQAQ